MIGCNRKTFGIDIEYFTDANISSESNGNKIRRIVTSLRRKGHVNSSTDHGYDVFEHRCVPSNRISDVTNSIKKYYNDLSKSGCGKIYFDSSFCIGAHMHLHVLRYKFNKVFNTLNTLALWYNSRNPSLWKERLESSYGEIYFNRDMLKAVELGENITDSIRTDVFWGCDNSDHMCFEYRAFNSGNCREIKMLLSCVNRIIKNNCFVSGDFINFVMSKDCLKDVFDRGAVDNVARYMSKIETQLKKFKIIGR